MADIIPTVGILVYRDQEILLVRHGEKASHLTGVYGLPAGKLEAEETELETAVRELFEETGLKTTSEALTRLKETYVAAIPRKDGTVKTFSFAVFVCRSYNGTLRGNEETAPEWVKIAELGQYCLLPNVQQAVMDGMKYR